MPLSKLEYELVEYTISDEPLRILITGFTKNIAVDKLFRTLIHLVTAGYIVCFSDDSAALRPIRITLSDLNRYYDIRIKNKEKMDDYPASCNEYNFYATEKGIKLLRKKDQPARNNIAIKGQDIFGRSAL